MSYYASAALPWTVSEEDERRFRTILRRLLILFVLLSVIMPFLPLPKVDRQEAEVPPRLAKLVLERQAPPPPPVVKAPEPEAVKPDVTKERKPLTRAEQQARKQVQNKGLGALAGELAKIADSSDISAMASRRVTTSAAGTQVATIDTNILTAEGGRRTASGGPRQVLQHGTTAPTKLADGRSERVAALLTDKGQIGTGKTSAFGVNRAGKGKGRAEEDVAVVMDRHKSVLYALYNRARRNNPGLKGKIVLVITILPSGRVADVVVKSNELNAPELEASLLARVRQLDFGVSEGGPFTVTIPVEFLPS
ncbi:MAG: TonB family protein [Gammaproteobacteria bacterium]